MKRIVFLFLVFIHSAIASSVEVRLLDTAGTKLNCEIEQSQLGLFCQTDNKQKVVIKRVNNSFVAVVIPETKEGALFNVLSIVKKDPNSSNTQLLYHGDAFQTKPFPYKSNEDKYRQYRDAEFLITHQYNRFTGGFENATPGETIFEKLSGDIKSEVSKKLSAIQNKYKEDKYKITRADGSEVVCTRAQSGCQIFRCGKDKSGQSLFFALNQNPEARLAEILAIKNGKIPNSPDIVEVRSQKSGELLLTRQPGKYIAPKEVENIPNQMKGESHLILRGEDGNFRSSLDESMNNCRDKTVQLALNQFDQRLAQLQLAQYVSLNLNSLNGSFVPVDGLPNGSCRENGIFYDIGSYQYIKSVQPAPNPKTMSFEQAQKLFDMAKGMDDIAWNYKADGCYARAHLMARRFEELGYRVDKAWVNGNLQSGEDKDKVRWGYHVAPVVYINNAEGKPEPYVIDPSVQSTPVKMKEWASQLKLNKDTTIVDSVYPFPQNALMFNRISVALSSSEPYMPNEDIDITEERKLVEAEKTMFMYKGL